MGEGWLLWIAHTLGSVVPLALLVWVTSIPAPLHDAVIDMTVVLFFYAFAFVLYGTSLLDISLPILILIGVGAVILVREAIIWRREYYARMKIVLALEKQKEEAKLQQLYSGTNTRAGTATATATATSGIDDFTVA